MCHKQIFEQYSSFQPESPKQQHQHLLETQRASMEDMTLAHSVTTTGHIQGAPKNNNPLGKFDISGIVADFFAKFTAFIEED